MGSRSAVLRSVAGHPQLRRLEGSFVGFSIAEHATWISTLVYAFQIGGISQAGSVAFVLLVLAMLVAPVVAYAGDRFRRDHVLIAGYSAQAACMAATALAMQAGADALLVYLFAAMSAALVTVARPSIGALLPFVVDTPADLAAANVMMGILENVGIFIGPMVASLLLMLASPALVFAVMAAMMAVCALVVARLPGDRDRLSPPGSAEPKGGWSDVLGGFNAMRNDGDVATLIANLETNLLPK